MSQKINFDSDGNGELYYEFNIILFILRGLLNLQIIADWKLIEISYDEWTELLFCT